MTRRFHLPALTRRPYPALLLLLSMPRCRLDAAGRPGHRLRGCRWRLSGDGSWYIRCAPGCPKPALAVPAEGRQVNRDGYADGRGTFRGLFDELDDAAEGPTLRQLAFSEGKARCCGNFLSPRTAPFPAECPVHQYDMTALRRTVASVDPLNGRAQTLPALDGGPETDRLAYVVCPPWVRLHLGFRKKPACQKCLSPQSADSSLPIHSMALNRAGRQ